MPFFQWINFILLECFILQFQRQQQPFIQTQQGQQGHQNPSISSGSSSSQKHLQNQQHKPHESELGGIAIVIQIQPFAESSAESICTELAAAADANSECYSPSPYSPSTIDSQVSGSNISIYGQNLMPIHLTNFALMNPTPVGGAYSASGNTSEKKPQQSQTLAFKSSDVSFFCNFICFHQRNHSFPRS